MEDKKIPTFDEVMLMMAENAKGFAEIRELQKTNEKEMKAITAEAERRAAERVAEEERRATERAIEEAKRNAEAEKRNAEEAKRNAIAEKRNAEADKRLKRLEELVGGMNRNSGLYAEEFFQRTMAKTLTFAGIKFDKLISNLKVEKKESCEFDILMVNGNSVAIIEAKNRIHPDFVEEVATKKLKQFRKNFPEYANYKVYLGVAGMSFDDKVVEVANRLGVGIVRQDGKSIEMNTDFVKEY